MKRVISFLFVSALFVSLVACGGSKETKEAEVTAPETEVVDQVIVDEPQAEEIPMTEELVAEEVAE